LLTCSQALIRALLIRQGRREEDAVQQQGRRRLRRRRRRRRLHVEACAARSRGPLVVGYSTSDLYRAGRSACRRVCRSGSVSGDGAARSLVAVSERAVLRADSLGGNGRRVAWIEVARVRRAADGWWFELLDGVSGRAAGDFPRLQPFL